MYTATSFEEFQARILPGLWGPPVLTVGSFDGVHLGHQFLLHELVQWARRRTSPAVVVTFVAHPRALVDQTEIRRLMLPHQKLRLLESMGVDAVVMVEFDAALRMHTAAEFCRSIVKERLGANALLVGHNNFLGRDREGTPERLAQIGVEAGIEVRVAARVEVDGNPISSSAIREHIERGDFHWARKMLGRAYSLGGRIESGRRLGRTIGFPTINVPLVGVAHPPLGVYGVKVALEGAAGPIPGPLAGLWMGAANLGVRPTVEDGRTEPLLEVHIVNADGSPPELPDLNGCDADVEFSFRVRDERKFDGIDALKAQLRTDVETVRQKFEQGEGGASASGRFDSV